MGHLVVSGLHPLEPHEADFAECPSFLPLHHNLAAVTLICVFKVCAAKGKGLAGDVHNILHFSSVLWL